MPLAFRPGDPRTDPAVLPFLASPSTDGRVRGYGGGYEVMRGYEAAARPQAPRRDAAWHAERR
jgi:hypothetical protein